MDRTTAERLRGDVDALCGAPRHRSRPEHLVASREHCRTALESAGWRCELDEFTVAGRPRWADRGRGTHPLSLTWLRGRGVNLVASRAPIRAGATWLIAHLDSVAISPGADDNASGVAVALEVARRLPADADDVVIAIVDLEELAQLGSRALLARWPRPGAVVCLEAVGFFASAPGTQRLPTGASLVFADLPAQIKARQDRADFVLAVHRPRAHDLLTRWLDAAQTVGLPALALLDRRADGAAQALTRWANPLAFDLDRSDHAPYWRARIPALMLTDTAPFRNPNYHSASDTPQTLNYPQMAQVAAAALLLTASRLP